MTLRQFEVFLAVARARSFRRAGEALHLSQPALSQHVRELETALGARLFDRLPRSVALTETSVSVVHNSPEPQLLSNGSSASEESIPLSFVPVRAPLVPRRPFLPTHVAALVFVVLFVVVGFWTYRARHTSRTNLNFNARDLVLVSRFENRTGEPVLDGTVEFVWNAS